MVLLALCLLITGIICWCRSLPPKKRIYEKLLTGTQTDGVWKIKPDIEMVEGSTEIEYITPPREREANFKDWLCQQDGYAQIDFHPNERTASRSPT